MQTIHITLDAPEVRGLYSLAETECRPLREQVRYMLRNALRERGLLPEATDCKSVDSAVTKEAANVATRQPALTCVCCTV